MNIRKYKVKNANELWRLVFNTVHTINIMDYSLDQVKAWAPDNIDNDWWKKELFEKSPYVIEHEGVILGYADIQHNGHINHFFVDCNHQRKQIGTKILAFLVIQAKEKNQFTISRSQYISKTIF
ncbi:TPA: GNAT family N-acetyltransferase [Yersinia enterocolitica]